MPLAQIQLIKEAIFQRVESHIQENTWFFAKISLKGLLSFIHQDQMVLAQQFELDPAKIHGMDEYRTQQLINNINNYQSGTFFLRHGEQLSGEEITGLTDNARKKVEMMREHANLNDNVSPASLLEFLGTAYLFLYIQAQFPHLTFRVESSKNLRAWMTSDLLASLLAVPCRHDAKYDCVNYRAETDCPYSELKQFLKPDGSLPWEKSAVDNAVGPETFDRITAEMQETFSSSYKEKEIAIITTHSQQLSALITLSPQSLADKRLETFGHIGCYGPDNQFVLNERGVYAEGTLDALCEPVMKPSAFGMRR